MSKKPENEKGFGDFDCDEDEKACSAWLSKQSTVLNQDETEQPTTSSGTKGSKTMESVFGFLENKTDTDKSEGSSFIMTSAQASALGAGNTIIVNRCQQGNPVLDLIRGVPWKYADSSATLSADYILGPTTCCLFLSLRYHALKPEYIYKRLKLLQKGGSFGLRVLLCLVDIKDPSHSVRELTKTCLVYNVTLLLAFSNDEAATYLETFKAYQNKPSDSLQSRRAVSRAERNIEVLSSVRSINSTDANTLLSTFGCISNICVASPEELALCPGIGGVKANSLEKVFRQPFLKPKTPDS
ncbi:DNA excision repair protein ERCC-1-like [Clavelina lepadiformis]|uniref:DNA excision repair protein ERCC-1-like n=1 Tax=Clavelina lepadiformis TaxID=159417 RepID=UPI0040438D3B